MNNFQKQLEDKKQSKVEKAMKVVQISTDITKLIGIKPQEAGHYIFRLGKYNIVPTNRQLPFFGWVDIFEIIPKEYGDSVGFTSTNCPDYIEPAGLETMNCPPDEIIEEAMGEIKAFMSK